MFKVKEKSILVDTGVLEVLIPEEYQSKNMFIKAGEMFSLFCVVMARGFVSEDDYKAKINTKQYKPIILPYIITTKPSVVESVVTDVPLGSKDKKMFRLIYYRDDIFSKNLDYIKSSDNTQNFYNLFDDGKADFLPYTSILQALEEIHKYNETTLPVPIEAIETIVAEKCRLVSNHSVNARRGKEVPYAIQCLNPREVVMMDTSFNMFNFEDINTALMIAANKEVKNIVDAPSTLERIIGGDISVKQINN